jgi:hypothetical protein
VDFASAEVIKIFQERVSSGYVSTPESSSSFQRSGSPLTVVTKEKGGRRARNKLDCDDSSYRYVESWNDRRPIDLGVICNDLNCHGLNFFVLSWLVYSRRTVDGSKMIVSTELPSGSDKFHEDASADLSPKDVLTPGDEVQGKLSGSFRLKDGYTSPVSPDADHSALDNLEQSSEKTSTSNSKNKIDLSCHETDSAIVTSSSDVIVNEKSESDMNHGSSSSSVNGDDKLSSLEYGKLDNNNISILIDHIIVVVLY